MAWNEPGDKDKEKDPWSGKQKPTAPPDLDEAVRRLQKKLRDLFASKGIGKSGGKGTDNPVGQAGTSYGLSFIIIAVVVIWLLSGIFIVGPAEQAVVLRFGKYTTTLSSGPHWIPRFIDSKYIVNVQKVDNLSYSSSMLTKDENIVSVAMAVQYRIDQPQHFLFNVVNPRESLKQATASALRQVIGHTTLDQILTTGREVVRQDVKDQLSKIMRSYGAGILITDVALQPAKAPEEVKAAFDDAIKAQEDEQRYINQAQAYARGVEPIANGQAQRILTEADAYKTQVILQSKGNVAQFLSILPEYEKQPQVTRERLYIDAIQSVLMHTSKILVDTKDSNNLFNMPLNRLLQSASAEENNKADNALQNVMSKANQADSTTSTSDDSSDRTTTSRTERDSNRSRRNY